jgi:RPA family protein
MTVAACITAWELTSENVSVASGGGFRTPYGIFSDVIFFVGTLTEKTLKNDQLSSLRISDPTGVITLSLVPQNTVLIRTAETLDIPSFVAITATVKFRICAGKSHLELHPVILTPVNRKIRDAWLCCVAIRALARITAFPPSSERKKFVDVLRNALTNVKDENFDPISMYENSTTVTDNQLLLIIAELSGKKGATISDVISRVKTLGMSEIDAKNALSRLMEKGECYAPTIELIKIA